MCGVDHTESQIQVVILKGFKETVLDFEGGFHRDVAAAPQTPQLGGAQANFGGTS